MRNLLLGATLLAACGGGGGGDDAGPGDGGSPDAGSPADAGPLVVENCPGSYGPGLIAETFAVADSTEVAVGFDLDGDDGGDPDIDNAIGATDNLWQIINVDLGNSLNDGSLRLLAEIRMFSGLGGDDSSVEVVAYGGVDSDDPADDADDFGGDEDYYYSHESVESATCAPKALLAGDYTDGTLDVGSDVISFIIESLGGALRIERARYQGTLEADTEGLRTPTGMAGLLGGVITQCSLNRAPPSLLAYSLQHDLTRLFQLQPDIDLDGDGLETVQTVDNQTDIVTCTDGDGTTLVEGGDCGCDPRMADGYSIAFTIDFRGATVLGPNPTP